MCKKALLGGIARLFLVHGVGTLVIATLTLVPYLNQGLIESFGAAMAHDEFRAFTAFEIFIHVGLAACAWAFLYIMFRLIMTRKREGRRVFKVARGTAITETLIVLPVFFILTGAIMQLAVNNIAATLTNLAAFQSARTVWVWAGEWQGDRRGVDYYTLMTKARVQAAYALTPVAPGDFVHNPYFVADTFKQARAGMVANQLPILTTDQGALGFPLAYALELEDPGGLIRSGKKNSLAQGLDATSFRLRSVRKFTWAYNATHVIPFAALTRAGAVVIYSHHIALPVMPWIFGQSGFVSGRSGYYMTIVREFNFQGQLEANPDWPS